jgi:hypothetical protein
MNELEQKMNHQVAEIPFKHNKYYRLKCHFKRGDSIIERIYPTARFVSPSTYNLTKEAFEEGYLSFEVIEDVDFDLYVKLQEIIDYSEVKLC